MFFFMGVGDKARKLNFDQFEICKCCYKYGHIETYEVYTCFSLFLIPLLKWNKRYYAVMSCCKATGQLDERLAMAIDNGQITSIEDKYLKFAGENIPRCSDCGYIIKEDFKYCPSCGNDINNKDIKN